MRTVLLLMMVLAVPGARAADIGQCAISAGPVRADVLAAQCLRVIHSRSTCVPQVPCGVLEAGIRQGCAALGLNDPLRLPRFCGNYLPQR